MKPTAFLNRNGKDITGKMYDTPRPAHVCHLRVHEEVRMQDISNSFDQEMMYFLDYFLLLPQSAGRISISPPLLSTSMKSTSTSKLRSVEVLDANIFSPPSKSEVAMDLTKKVLNTKDEFLTIVQKTGI